jgi:uncharacterized protein
MTQDYALNQRAENSGDIGGDTGGVSAAMRTEIRKHLAQLEGERSIRILFAAESGSRAWGFASPNSDYDVRFVYVPTPDWYLSVSSKRDVIERMLPGDVDLSGWELRKALRLFKRYNGALNEWLGSPIQYREASSTSEAMSALMPRLFRPAAALHHYGSMANSALLAMTESGPVSAKKLCYLLRALFACRHVLRFRSQPPTAFGAMLDSLSTDAQERAWIDALLHAKAAAPENATIALSAAQRVALSAEIAAALAARATIGGAQKAQPAALDALLRSAVLGFTGLA